MFSGIFMFLGVGGLAALITALFEFTFSYLAKVNTILILNYSYWKTTLYALSIAIRHFQFEGENQAITLHNLSAKMCRKIFRFLNKITNLCLAQNRSQNIYSIEQQLAMAVYGLVSFEKYPVLVWHCEHVLVCSRVYTGGRSKEAVPPPS